MQEEIQYSVQEVYTARRWFDGYVQLSPSGCRIVHSTQDRQPAMDSDKGGMFTLALLHGCFSLPGHGGHAPIRIEALLGYAKGLLGVGEDPQVPEIVYETGDLAVPFALDAPWPGRALAVWLLGGEEGD